MPVTNAAMPAKSVRPPLRLVVIGACALAFLAMMTGHHQSGTEQAERTQQQTQRRAQFTKLRPDLSSSEYWHQRCRPYLDNLAKIKASTYHGWADHEQDLARGAWDVCAGNENIEDNGVGPNIRDTYEAGERNLRGQKGVFLAEDAGLITPGGPGIPAATAGSAPAVHTSADGCDLAGAIPNCKETMAKLMAAAPH